MAFDETTLSFKSKSLLSCMMYLNINDVTIPSITAKGIWVIANTAANALKEAITPPDAAGKAKASWIDVPMYVAQSAKVAAKKTAKYRFSLDFMAIL